MLRKTFIVCAVAGLVLIALSGGRSLGWKLVERQIRSRFPHVPHLPADSLDALLARSDSVVLLDVRTEAEFRVSHLRGARRIAPGASSLTGVPEGASVVVYCSVGYRSSALAARLRKTGFHDVQNLEGGIFRWANEGGTVVRSGEPVEEVHPYDRWWGLLLKRGLAAYSPRAGDS